jgi:FAD/FMN-containing dehydrogenase
MSGTLRVAATERLGRVEQQLASAGLTLGPQPAHVLDLTVSEWLEGPWEGLRAIPGGRLEPAALAVDAAIPKGRYISRESPRSATGPDLDALVLGRRKKNVRLEWAVLRGLPLQEDRRHLLSELASARDAVAVLRALIRRDVAMVSARARRAGPGMTVEIQIAGSRRRVERDSAVFLEEARNLGATCSESTPSPPVEAAADSEVAWDDLELALQNGGDLYRLARESVEVVTSSDLGVGTRLWPTPSPAPLAGPLRRLLEPFAEQAG